MLEFLLNWLVVALVLGTVIYGMSIGVRRGRQPIKGSCGGLNNALGGGTEVTGKCSLCGAETIDQCGNLETEPGGKS